MSTASLALRGGRTRTPFFAGSRVLLRGVVLGYLSLLVLLPLAGVVWKSTGAGWDGFRVAISSPDTVASFELTLLSSLGVSVINAVLGTIVAWVLIRDHFPGKGLMNSVIDLPFALPTIVAGLTLLSLYGPQSPVGIDVAYTRAGIIVALLFVTLPFVVRAVQPVLMELDRDMEEAAASLGAGGRAIFRRIVLPNLFPAIFSGVALGFARAMAIRRPGLDIGEHSLPHGGRFGSHFHADRKRQRDGRGGDVGGAARDIAVRAGADHRGSALGAAI